jgi:nicotinate phosphoribosyltransferase
MNAQAGVRIDPNGIAARTDKYFTKTRAIVQQNGDCRVTYAVFMRTDVVTALQPAIDFLKGAYPSDVSMKDGYALSVRPTVKDGTLVASGKPLMYVTGSMEILSEMETLFLQRVGFACVSAYNAYRMALALPKAAFLAMDARHCTGDDMHLSASYGASVGSDLARRNGAKGFVGSSTDLAAPLFGATSGMGTMPHALVGYAKAVLARRGPVGGASGSATLEAAKMYVATHPKERSLTVLVDFDGREISDSLEVCRWFYGEGGPASQGWKLGFRLDTHGGRFLEGLDWDASVRTLMRWTHKATPGEVFRVAMKGIEIDEIEGRSKDDIQDKYLFGTGVTAANVIAFRKALDDGGFKQPTIVASSGFDVLKCRIFANLDVPVDIVGTGSYMPSRLSATYATADIVEYAFEDEDGVFDAHRLVKVGREHLIPTD